MSDGVTSSISLAIETGGIASGAATAVEQINKIKGALLGLTEAGEVAGSALGKGLGEKSVESVGQASSALLSQASHLGNEISQAMKAGMQTGFAGLSTSFKEVETQLGNIAAQTKAAVGKLEDLSNLLGSNMTKGVAETIVSVEKLKEALAGDAAAVSKVTHEMADLDKITVSMASSIAKVFVEAEASTAGFNAQLIKTLDLDALIVQAADKLALSTIKRTAAEQAYADSAVAAQDRVNAAHEEYLRMEARRIEQAQTWDTANRDFRIAAERTAQQEINALHASALADIARRTEQEQGWYMANRDFRIAAERSAQQEINAIHASALSDIAKRTEQEQAWYMANRDMRIAEAKKAQAGVDAAHAEALNDEKRRIDQLHAYYMEENAWRVAEAKKTAAEVNRVALLNNNFNTASPTAQLGTAKKAEGLVSMGMPALAIEQYGISAVSAIPKIAEMEKALLSAGKSAGAASIEHAALNDMMKEGHSLARGLAGPLGAMWLTWGSIAPLLAGAAIASSLKGMIQSGKELEYQLTFIAALNSEGAASTEQFAHAIQGTMVSSKEAAEGLRGLAQAGLSVTQGLMVLPEVLNLATVGELSVARAAITATGVMHAFGLEITDIGRIGDIFAKAAAISNTSVSSMAESMKEASVVAEIFHVKIDEVAAGLVVLAQRNITGTSAGTSLKNMMTDMLTPTKKQADMMKALHIEMYNADKTAKNLGEMIAELADKLVDLNEKGKNDAITAMFNKRDTKAIAALVADAGEYGRALKEIQDKSQGFTNSVVQALGGTLEGQLKRTANTLSIAFDTAFEKTADGWSNLVSRLNSDAASSSIQELLKVIGNLGLTLAEVALFIAEHGKQIALLAAAYFVLSPAVVVYNAAVKEAMLATAAQTAGTVLQTTSTVAQTTATIAQASATELAAAATASFGRIMAAVAWPIAAVTALAAAYYYLSNGIDAATAAEERRENKSKDLVKAQEAEIDRIKKKTEVTEYMTKTGAKQADAEAYVAGKSLENSRQLTAAAVKSAEARLKATPNTFNNLGEQNPAYVEAANALNEARKLDLANQARYNNEAKALSGLKNANDTNDRANQKAGYVKDALDMQNTMDKLAVKGRPGAKELAKRLKEETANIRNSGADADATAQVEKLKMLHEEVNNFTKDAPNVGKPKATPGEGREFQVDLSAIKQHFTEAENIRKLEYSSEEKMLKEKFSMRIITTLDYLKQSAAIEDKDQAERKKNRAKEDAELAAMKIPVKQRDTYLKELDTLRAKEDAAVALAKRSDEYKQKIELETAADKVLGEARKFADQQLPAIGDQLARGDAHKLEAYNLSLLKYAEHDVAAAKLQAKEAYGKEADAIQEKIKLRDTEIAAAEDLVRQTKAGTAENNIALVAVKQLNRERDALRGSAALIPAKQAEAVAKSGKAAQDLADMEKMNKLLQLSTVFAQRLTSEFAKVGKTIGGMTLAFTAYGAKQEEISNRMAAQEAARKAGGGTEVDRIRIITEAQRDQTEAHIKYYGDMAGSAKNFFSEHSRGYRVLAATEKTFHMLEMAQQIETFLVKSGFITAIMAIKNAEVVESMAMDGLNTTSSVTNSGIRASADGTSAIAKALSFAPPPYNFIAAGAVLAALVAAGVAMSGGVSGASGVDISKEQQDKQGSGSILGDASAKSDSLVKAMEILKNNSDMTMPVSQGMLAALHSIRDSIGGVAKFIAQTSGIAGTLADAKAVEGRSRSFAGFSSSDTKLEDQGITFGRGQTIGSIMAGGINASSYTTTKTDSSSWWGLSKSSSENTSNGGIPQALKDQFALTVGSLSKGVTEAAAALGQSGAAVQSQLSGVALGFDKISFKGMNGQQMQDALNAVFGKLADEMTTRIMPSVSQFQQVGEGLFQTLVRVGSAVDVSKNVLDKFGMSAISYTSVINKQGDVGTEIVRQTLANQESTQTVGQGWFRWQTSIVNGVGQMVNAFQGTAQELGKFYQTLLDLRAQMKLVNIDALNLNAAMIKGAGGASELATGLSSYFTNYFSATEKAAAETKAVSASFAQLGVQMPTSLVAFRQLIERTGTSSEAASTLTGKLLGLADAFYKATNDTAALTAKTSEIATVDSAKSALTNAYNTESTALKNVTTSMQAFAKSTEQFRLGLLAGADSPLTPLQKYLDAQKTFDSTLNAAKGGDKDAQGNLQSTATNLLNASKGYNASSQAYTTDFYKVQEGLKEMAASANAQASDAEKQLAVMKNEVSLLVTVNESVLTVAMAVLNLKAIMAADLAAKNPQEALKQAGIKAFGRPFTDQEMQFLGIDEGSKNGGSFTLWATEARQINSPLVVEMQGLRQEVAGLRKDQQAQTGDIIASNYDANQENADSVGSAIEDTYSSQNFRDGYLVGIV